MRDCDVRMACSQHPFSACVLVFVNRKVIAHVFPERTTLISLQIFRTNFIASFSLRKYTQRCMCMYAVFFLLSYHIFLHRQRINIYIWVSCMCKLCPRFFSLFPPVLFVEVKMLGEVQSLPSVKEMLTAAQKILGCLVQGKNIIQGVPPYQW